MFTLLPPTNKKNLLKEYRIRFGVVFFSMLGVAVFIGIASLSPAYFSVRLLHTKITGELTVVEESIKAKSDEDLEATLKSLKESLSILQIKEIALFPYFAHIVEKKTPAIKITGLRSTLSEGDLSIVIDGTASKRADLLEYSKTLKSGGLFSRIDLPVSNYTKESDLKFSMTAVSQEVEKVQEQSK